MDKQILYRFFKGTTSNEEDQQIVEWLENPLNKKTFDEEREFFNILLMLNDQSVVATKSKTKKLPRWAKELMRTAAILIFAIGAGFYFYANLEQRIQGYENSIFVPVGQFLGITLSDGTQVMLNGSSTLSYPAVFYGKERRVRLYGEAFFKVKGRSECPFIVETAQCDIEALGTEFNVESYGNNELLIVSLLKGKVKITNKNEHPESVVLLPDSEARLINGQFKVGKIPEYEAFLWREGLIAFKNATFVEVMVLFEKYYGVRIVYDTGSLPEETFSGKIRISEGIDHAMWVLRQNASFDYEKKPDSKIIIIK